MYMFVQNRLAACETELALILLHVGAPHELQVLGLPHMAGLKRSLATGVLLSAVPLQRAVCQAVTCDHADVVEVHS